MITLVVRGLQGDSPGSMLCRGVRLIHVFFFFLKQKPAYESKYGLVGSDRCIRDRFTPDLMPFTAKSPPTPSEPIRKTSRAMVCLLYTSELPTSDLA